ncbi:MAG: hypothetical protein KC442_17245 [Thermomicrobiales bacterium]|nr:hypothetical protein [Thermomicrobiales bacterium]
MAAPRQVMIAEVERDPPGDEWEIIDGELIPVSYAPMLASATGARIATRLWQFTEPRNLGQLTGSNGGYVLYQEAGVPLIWVVDPNARCHGLPIRRRAGFPEPRCADHR